MLRLVTISGTAQSNTLCRGDLSHAEPSLKVSSTDGGQVARGTMSKRSRVAIRPSVKINAGDISHTECVGWRSALWYSFLLWSLPVLRRWSSPFLASICSVWSSAWLCLDDWWGLLFGSSGIAAGCLSWEVWWLRTGSTGLAVVLSARSYYISSVWEIPEWAVAVSVTAQLSSLSVAKADSGEIFSNKRFLEQTPEASELAQSDSSVEGMYDAKWQTAILIHWFCHNWTTVIVFLLSCSKPGLNVYKLHKMQQQELSWNAWKLTTSC